MIRPGVGVSEALYLKPLVYGLDAPESPCVLHKNIPAQLSVAMSQRISPLEAGCAFLSPIDYARHAGDYRIAPGICAASSTATRTIQLAVRRDVHAVSRVAVDLRVTSEIVLLKIILLEKYSDLSRTGKSPEFVAMGGRLEEKLDKTDAALIVQLGPELPQTTDAFALDLVEEWVDLTDLPYPHGFWVGHEDAMTESLVAALGDARSAGQSNLGALADATSRTSGSSPDQILSYLSDFTYDLDDAILDGTSEFLRYAYYHGALKDIPDLKFALDDQA